MNAKEFINDLQWRGLISQATDLDGLTQRMAQGPVTLYCGFDPTAQSLHVGNLVPLLTLARFQRAGHRTLALVGGATGRIGDPSGKSAERDFQDPDVIAERTRHIQAQLKRFIACDDEARGKVVNNLTWTQNVRVLDFLRDIGKHFSVNAMMTRDSIKSRLEREDSGISFTEFSYMLLQAFDFLMLAQQENCALQIGGSDQWGNMCSGADLIRRKLEREVFAVTLPLLTTHDGKKFGKSEKGAVWVDEQMTSPWEFFQFWLNTNDKDVGRFLKLFTFIKRTEIEALEARTQEAPHLRVAQKRLAQAMTDLVHGESVRLQIEAAAEALFGKGDLNVLTADTLAQVARSVPHVQVARASVDRTVAGLLVQTGLESSSTRAATVVSQGGVVLNGVKAHDARTKVTVEQALHQRFVVLKKGKRDFAIVEFQ
ncbi:tyrosine--tRNA ligase [Paraburkholderia sp. UCT31]|uniref:tyrosine--tRNA ligase n=1 Tax=Paraburkholderia sp. UCT31 TaxID=2615209 RepID=UPI0016561809|nr:tyrosine--tRNA ligase [Paraburkholderia sp. UCT31]MBC8737296.1 tyrosine--tRNA ligase [Paraburkholderia sp. UCT31]